MTAKIEASELEFMLSEAMNALNGNSNEIIKKAASMSSHEVSIEIDKRIDEIKNGNDSDRIKNEARTLSIMLLRRKD